MRTLLLLIAGSLALSTSTFSQLAPVDSILQGEISSNITLSSAKRYLLRGFVNVTAPATITIQAGTIIFGEKSTKGTLIINRGAKIIAEGTRTRPIVFTSQQPAGQRGPGDWGGIIITGNASINVPGGTAVIEGGTGTVFGGSANPDDNDSSGVLRFVRIEFPGIAFLPDNEINGLTLGGVGRKTVIEYVQVSYSGDDSFEWFGGTVNGKYLIAYRGVDDDFDVDFGFRGKVQFALSQRDPQIADISGSNGWESDNDGTGTLNQPRTAPIFSNVTCIGPMADTSAQRNANFRRGAHIRRSSFTSIYNSIVMGWPTGLLLDGQNVANACLGDTLQIRNSIWAGLRAGNAITTNVSGFDATSWFNTPAYGNRSFVQPAEVRLVSAFHPSNPDPRPEATSPAAVGASFSNPRLADPFFIPTTYVGAFDPSGPRWDEGWTNYNPQFTDYTVTSVERIDDIVPTSYKLSQNYPNPFNPSTRFAYALPVPANVTIKIYSANGEEVTTLFDGYQQAGNYEANFNATGLSSGVYFYRLISHGFSVTKKMLLMK